MLAKLDMKYLQCIEFRQDVEMMEYSINREEDLLFLSIMIKLTIPSCLMIVKHIQLWLDIDVFEQFSS